MVAAGDQGSARRAAQSRCVEGVETQTLGREPIHRGRRNAATEGAELTKARVVDQYQNDVGRALRRLHRLRELPWIGVEIGAPDVAGEMEVRPRQHARCASLLGV